MLADGRLGPGETFVDLSAEQGEDGSVPFLTARDHVYCLPLTTRGFAPHLAPPPARRP